MKVNCHVWQVPGLDGLTQLGIGAVIMKAGLVNKCGKLMQVVGVARLYKNVNRKMQASKIPDI